VSSIFLLATLIIYTAYPKLLNNYTRLMRHFTANLMCAFVILSVNQQVIMTNHEPLCSMSGKDLNKNEEHTQSAMAIKGTLISAFLLQYFLLAAFNFMTVMSVEISQLIE
jgi:hypothetical protein